MEITGKRMTSAVKDVDSQITNIGKQIGAKAQKLGGDTAQINTKSVLKSFTKSLQDKNIKIKNGKLDFSSSDLKGLSSTGQTTLQEQYNLFRKVGVNARELLANNRDLGNRLFSGAKEAKFTGAEGILNKVRASSVNTMNKQYPDLKALNTQYSEMVKAYDSINHLAGAEGIKAPQVLRRIFGQAAGQSKEAVMELERIAKKYNIKSGLDIAKEAEFALEAEQALGVLPTSGLASQAVSAIPTSKVQVALKALEKFKGKIFGTPEQNLIKILENPTAFESSTMANKILKLLDQPIGTKVEATIIQGIKDVISSKALQKPLAFKQGGIPQTKGQQSLN